MGQWVRNGARDACRALIYAETWSRKIMSDPWHIQVDLRCNVDRSPTKHVDVAVLPV